MIRTAKWSSKSYPCVGAARCRILHTELLNKVVKDSHHCQKANQKIFFANSAEPAYLEFPRSCSTCCQLLQQTQQFDNSDLSTKFLSRC
ncbi:hypothetical protein pipiens_016319 [Culex pipiens pipiens]|uniref:Uncharacterized protein n=1 Tax=Culex pipiens pipiens TaxID=38569 RepID=A0ABD1CLT6_CULPP